MYRIDNDSVIESLPAPSPAGPNPNAYFTGGNPAEGQAATIVDAEWLNMVQEELCNIITGFGGTLSKGTRNQIYTILASGIISRIRLQAATTFYVSTAGNDANTGLTIGSPWLTPQHAFNAIAASYDLNGQQVTIQLADGSGGSYVNGILAGYQLVGQTLPIIVNGNNASPGNVIVGGFSALNGGWLTVQNLKINNPTGYNVFTSYAGQINVGGGIIFSATTGEHIHCGGGGNILCIGNYTIAGAASAHWGGLAGGTISLSNAGITVTITGNPNFSQAFMNLGGLVMFFGGATFSGTATGVRYNVQYNSVANTGGITLPGNSSGVTSTGGQYN